MGSTHKALLPHTQLQEHLREKHRSTRAIELQAEVAVLFTNHHFYLKEQMQTNYDYSDLEVWQTFFQK